MAKFSEWASRPSTATTLMMIQMAIVIALGVWAVVTTSSRASQSALFNRDLLRFVCLEVEEFRARNEDIHAQQTPGKVEPENHLTPEECVEKYADEASALWIGE